MGKISLQRALARTLERRANEGPDLFYKGEIADRIADDFAANGGFVTREDLATSRVNVPEPLRGSDRGLAVMAAGPPAAGITLLQMLNFLEGFDIGSHGWPSTEAARALVEAMAWAVADRDLHVADPRFVDVPTGALADKGYAAKARAVAAVARGAGIAGHDRPESTHVCMVDDSGNVVSLTHTLDSPTGVLTPRLGFVYNPSTTYFDPHPSNPTSL